MHIHQLYQNVTAQIVAELERGVIPWIKPWKGTSLLPTNIATGNHYSGINIPLLWFAADRGGYARNEWLTYKQAVEKGAQVRKGEKGTHIVYTSTYKKDEEQPGYRFLKTFSVFNVEQVDGIATNDHAVIITDHERHQNAETVIATRKADIRHGNYEAMYVPSKDVVFMPRLEAFISPENYYATIFHELGHYTGHMKRLNRDLKGRFGDQSYAAEELVAELTSAFVCASLNISGDIRHASYIANWIQLLKSDERALFTAASKAQLAADFIQKNNKASD